METADMLGDRHFKHLLSLSTSWLSLFESGEGSDMSLVCKGKVEVFCHSLVLRARCPTLLASLNPDTNPHGLERFTAPAVRGLLGYLYGGVVGWGEAVMEEVEVLAQQLGLVELTQRQGKGSVNTEEAEVEDFRARCPDQELGHRGASPMEKCGLASTIEG